MKKKEFNGYGFDDISTAKRMRYVVVEDGDLDINNAYGFKTKKELLEYMKGKYSRGTQTVFQVKFLGKFRN